MKGMPVLARSAVEEEKVRYAFKRFAFDGTCTLPFTNALPSSRIPSYACEQMRTRSTAPNSGCSSLATDIPLLRDMALTKWPGSTSLHRPDRAGETNFRGLLGREGADRRTRE